MSSSFSTKFNGQPPDPFQGLHNKEIVNAGRKGPGGLLDISLGGEVRRGPSYPDPV